MRNRIIFLGTGAGDLGMLKQSIATSSLYFEFDGLKFILDAGPGTVVNAVKNKINLLDLDGLIITHPHPDHCTDANVLIDSLRKNNSFLIVGKMCLEESKNYYPCIGKFQQTIPEKVISVIAGSKNKIKNVEFEAVENNHLDCGLGIKLLGTKKIGYVGDGSITGLEKHYKNMDLLIFNILIPSGKKAIKGVHTSVDEVIEFMKKTKPKKIVIQHFSLEMLNAGIDAQAHLIQDKTGIETICAKDGMVLPL